MKKVFLSIIVLLTYACTKNTGIGSKECPSGIAVQDATKANRKVLIIGIDGVRTDAITTYSMPFLDSLSTTSDSYFNPFHGTERITMSGPNWSSICTGVHIEKHKVKGNSFSKHKLDKYPHFGYYLSKDELNLKVASIVHWKPINEHIVADNCYLYPQYEYEDEQVRDEAIQLLLGQSVPDVLFLHFDDVDAAGHGYGFSGEISEYNNALKAVDQLCKSIFDVVNQDRQNGNEWMVVFVSDHGGEGTSHSDGNDENTNNTLCLINAPNVVFQSFSSQQVDIVPTVFHYLGVESEEFDCRKQGESMLWSN